MDNLTFTLIQAECPDRLAKQYSLDADGRLDVKAGGMLVSGNATRVAVPDLNGFASYLQGLKTHQALAYGVTPSEQCRVLSEDAWSDGMAPETITRTRKHFRYENDPGIMFLDHDQDGSDRLSCEILFEYLQKAAPGILNAGALWWPSSSSHITRNGIDLTGLRGQRIYLPVASAADIPRAGHALFVRLWLYGHGWIKNSKSGTQLQRSVVDASVWQPERLDFAAGADCVPPLTQERGAPVIVPSRGDRFLDTQQAIPPLSDMELERFEAMVAEAKRRNEPEASRIKETWIAERLENPNLFSADTPAVECRATLLRAITSNELGPDFYVTIGTDGNEQSYTVDEILSAPEKFDRKRARDPVEPDVYGGQPCAVLYLNPGNEHIYSFAHGGCRYRLCRRRRTLEIAPGNTHLNTDLILDELRQFGGFYDRGESLVKVHENGQMAQLDKHALGHQLAHEFDWMKPTPKGGRIPVDPPAKICEQILSLGRMRGLRELKQVVTAPLILPGGRLVTDPGYDNGTGLYLACSDEFTVPNLSPTVEDAIAALDRLWVPFEEFPFVGSVDRGVYLSALITAVVRHGLSLAPAFGLDAAEQGSGKTLLARCLGAVATGKEAVITPHVQKGGEEEIRKRIFANLLAGVALIVWDNVVGIFDSPAFAAMLTTPVYSDRRLGVSETSTVPSRAMWVVTGNNLTPAGDMPRRLAIARIEPHEISLFSRSFSLDPEKYCLGHRSQIVSDVITLILAYRASGAEPAPGKIPTFEEWDELVRQPVAWIAGFDERFEDPVAAFSLAAKVDPQREQDGALFAAIYAVYREGEFKAEDLYKVLQKACSGANGFYPAPKVSDQESTLASTLAEFSRTGTGKDLNTRFIGGLLRYRKGRTAAGLRLKSQRKVSNSAIWSMKLVDPEAYGGGAELVEKAEAAMAHL